MAQTGEFHAERNVTQFATAARNAGRFFPLLLA
jgi:hypothetical protein